ncbi:MULTISPECIES: zinc dependent phospholipase C family protein [Idiomarina]|uniref:zinc dependent phospholipase C family protein n=1 Tax=Idiomarina TaxID=135575 RepID=UPI002582EFC8|nr:zinc dependent phospholipase C family protein [Idiomarina sp.]
MPGAFAHLSVANVAREFKELKNLNIDSKVKAQLGSHLEFIELGSVSPDYPYLTLTLFGRNEQTEWADYMHLGDTKRIVEALIENTKALSDENKLFVFPWLAGYISHVIADVTIHPVVECKVGPYKGNEKAHRICEMNQDTYIWFERTGLGEPGYCERIAENLTKYDVNEKFNPTIQKVWSAALREVYPEEFEQSPPDIESWHDGFRKITGTAEETHKLFEWARHVAVGSGSGYPLREEVDFTYIRNLKTPVSNKDYDEIFDLAVANVRKYWEFLAAAVFDGGDTSMFKHWDLDNGVDRESGKQTMWENVS